MEDRKKYTDKEWEELASALSGEDSHNPELLKEFMSEDLQKTGDKWKEIKDMSDKMEIDMLIIEYTSRTL